MPSRVRVRSPLQRLLGGIRAFEVAQFAVGRPGHLVAALYQAGRRVGGWLPRPGSVGAHDLDAVDTAFACKDW